MIDSLVWFPIFIYIYYLCVYIYIWKMNSVHFLLEISKMRLYKSKKMTYTAKYEDTPGHDLFYAENVFKRVTALAALCKTQYQF